MSGYEFKVLPFKGAQGAVPGHALTYYAYSGVGSAPKSVVFETFDNVAEMPLEIVVQYQRVTEYMKKTWPKGGRIVAVILDNGTRIHAEAMSARHSDGSYERAPILARDTIYIRAMMSHETLIEVTGAMEYLRTGKPEAIIDPWARDNAAYAARMGGAA